MEFVQYNFFFFIGRSENCVKFVPLSFLKLFLRIEIYKASKNRKESGSGLQRERNWTLEYFTSICPFNHSTAAATVQSLHICEERFVVENIYLKHEIPSLTP